MNRIIFPILISLFVVSCMQSSYGDAKSSPEIPKKAVFIHTTDTHAKYFPFWLEPNMFDRKMGIQSDQKHCWDTGGSSWLCDKDSEDLNRDGICDVRDCQRCWDKNGNDRCDKSEDVDGTPGCSVEDCKILDKVEGTILCWDLNKNDSCDTEEDKNLDHNCDYLDCRMVWDANQNDKCDFPYRASDNTFIAEDGTAIPYPDDEEDLQAFAKYNNARSKSEDMNRDGRCDKLDYRPGLANVGGVARAATIIKNIREEFRNSPVFYFDSGDTFQGAPQFNLFKGEVEMKSMQTLGVDAMTIGNHEFDNGTSGFVTAYKKSGGFPLLASNYMFYEQNHKGLKDITLPYVILNKEGLRVGVVGVGNDSSLSSISDIGNSLGFNGLNPFIMSQLYVDMIRPKCDIVVLLSHKGLNEDYELAEKIEGVDIVMGGHHHVILDPVKVLKGIDGRDVLVVHSGVNLKVVGQLEVAVEKRDRKWPEIVWHRYKTKNVVDSVPEDPRMKTILNPYERTLALEQDMNAVVGVAKSTILRNDPNGGDSPLGNMVTDAMMYHDLVRAQFAVTNSMGIRADIPTGEIRREKLYEVFPFENSISILYMSGAELQEMFDYIARKSSSRGCKSQVQVAGMHMELDCSPSKELQDARDSYALTKNLEIGGVKIVEDYKLILPFAIFKMATNDYMGKGGSGFKMLKLNTTRLDTSISIRDALVEYMDRLGGEIDPRDFVPENRRIIMSN